MLSTERLSIGRRLRWLLLAFAPSSLMLGVTNYITTDIASVPLLDHSPALYLLTMVFAFSQKKFFSARFGTLIVPGATIVLLMLYLADTSGSGSRILVLLHLGYFFFAALMCHTQLADDRPGAQHLAHSMFGSRSVAFSVESSTRSSRPSCFERSWNIRWRSCCRACFCCRA